MAGIKGKTGKYKRSDNNIKSLSLCKSGENNPNWGGGVSLDREKYNKEYWKDYKIKNREKIKANNQINRVKRKGAIGSFSGKEWLNILEKYNFRCVFCGVHDSISKMTVDHITPLSKGGTNYIENIQPLCFKCNRKKGNRVIQG